MKRKKQFITLQMFDVRPVTMAGSLDFEKIEKIKPLVKLKTKRYFSSSGKKIGNVFYDIKEPDIIQVEAKRLQELLKKEKELKKLSEVYFVPISSHDLDNVHDISVSHTPASLPASPARFDPARRADEPICLVDRHISEKLYNKPEEQNTVSSLEKGFISEEPRACLPEIAVSEILPETDYFQKFEKKPFQRLKKGRKNKGNLNVILARDILFLKRNSSSFFSSFAFTALIILALVGGASLVGKALEIKDVSFRNSQKAYASLTAAKGSITDKDFQKASGEFKDAHEEFSRINSDLENLGKITIGASRYLPYVSRLSSGSHLAQAGRDISQIGLKLTKTLEILEKIKNPREKDESISILKIFQETSEDSKEIFGLLQDTQENLNAVNIDDIPEEYRDQFISLKEKLPEINKIMSNFANDSRIFTDILGGNGPRKYIFLFQNNQEMRATGGFIGTYALLDIFNGRVRNFFVDGIFNPDGQLKEKVVPPVPIGKISAAWSLHDSNWWPDFPKSAEKAAWFYEKTGGPTVDGVITMTPTVMQKLLEITGPIEMPEYDVTVDKDNFIEKIQYEVEVDYDKELNQPKKILADLAPKILDRILNMDDASDLAKVTNVLLESLNEKHILIYSMKYDIQKVLSSHGWSGEILSATRDYISVVNTNINGFKTDGVIDENINHVAEIQSDGSIIDTITIVRHHNGGKMKYAWWNKVNADYMRVYVPKGSKLISVSGQTREFNSPPLDYDDLGFKRDPQVKIEEDSMQVDEESGTKIYNDGDKTVFANWVYVSPQETVEIKYSYLLPFKIKTNNTSKPADTYSLLAQKQSGSLGSRFTSQIIYPNFYQVLWKYPQENLREDSLPDHRTEIKMETDLKTDKFVGVALNKPDVYIFKSKQ